MARFFYTGQVEAKGVVVVFLAQQGGAVGELQVVKPNAFVGFVGDKDLEEAVFGGCELGTELAPGIEGRGRHPHKAPTVEAILPGLVFGQKLPAQIGIRLGGSAGGRGEGGLQAYQQGRRYSVKSLANRRYLVCIPKALVLE